MRTQINQTDENVLCVINDLSGQENAPVIDIKAITRAYIENYLEIKIRPATIKKVIRNSLSRLEKHPRLIEREAKTSRKKSPVAFRLTSTGRDEVARIEIEINSQETPQSTDKNIQGGGSDLKLNFDPDFRHMAVLKITKEFQNSATANNSMPDIIDRVFKSGVESIDQIKSCFQQLLTAGAIETKKETPHRGRQICIPFKITAIGEQILAAHSAKSPASKRGRHP